MHHETPDPADAVAAPDHVPTASVPAEDRAASFGGRTPGPAAAMRAGVAIGGALVVTIGAAVVLGASPSAAPSGAGAQASATTVSPSDGARRPNGDGFGRGGLGFGPFGFGPGPAVGPIDGRDHGGLLGAPFGRITVTAISGSSISLATDDGWTRTITVTADTTITKGGQPATIAEAKVGDIVRFGEKQNDDGTWTITALAILQPQVAGTVTAISQDSITITARDGTSRTITTNSATVYRRGSAAGSRADVTVGSTIVAVGERGTNDAITATTVTVRLPRVVGTVSAVTSNSITVTRRDGTTLTIHVGSDTSIRVAGVDSATMADIKTGMVVAAEGSQRADGSLDATAIRAGQPGRLRGPVDAPTGVPASPQPSTSQG